MEVIGWAFYILFFIIMVIAVVAPKLTKDQTDEW